MQAVLKNDDLLREIFSYLRPLLKFPDRDDYSPDYAGLYKLALVCKQFSFHALDALWLVMDSMSPFLELIPGLTTGDDDKMHLQMPLSAEDLVDFERYARRVRIFEYDGEQRASVPAMLHISQVLNRRSFFPNLRRIYTPEKTTDEFFFLIGPALEYIGVSGDSEEEVSALLSFLSLSAPCLQWIEIKGQDIPDDSWSITHRFPQLKKLHITNGIVLDGEDFMETYPFAGQLISLRLNSLAVEDGDLDKYRRGRDTMMRFNALTDLTLSQPENVKDIAELFIYPLLPKLRQLTLHSPVYNEATPYEAEDNQDWRALFSALCQSGAGLNRLTILYSRARQAVFFEDEAHGITIEELLVDSRPRALSTFILEVPVIKDVPLKSIPLFGLCFPQLTKLALHLRNSALLDFSGLATLAMALPHLKQLDVSLNGTIFGTVPILCHRLYALSIVTNSIIQEDILEYTARHIVRIFPYVQVIRTVSGNAVAYAPGEKFMKLYKKVVRLTSIVGALQGARHDEAYRIQQFAQIKEYPGGK